MTDHPKPGPVAPAPPIRALPVKGAGLNDDQAESRSRTVAMLLPYLKDADDLLMVAEWITEGPEET